jgi:hypothetical protein
MIRSLLAHAWKLVAEDGAITVEQLIARLSDHQERWLDSPSEETSNGMTPWQLMEMERRLMPIMADCKIIGKPALKFSSHERISSRMACPRSRASIRLPSTWRT